MIPMLILYCLRKLKKTPFFVKRIRTFKKLALRLGLLLTLMISNVSYSNTTNPNSQIVYNVVRNNTVIGTISVSRSVNNDSTVYALDSKIKAKYILKFNITGKETSVFKNGMLVYSSIFREVNNRVKANHSVVYQNEQYHLKNEKGFKELDLNKIHRNLVTLYFKEPKGETKVFCDNAKSMSNIESIGNGKYRVSFPNGKYNVFHYKNGSCIKIEANSTLFSVTLIPA